MASTSVGQVVPFPSVGVWSRIAAKYVEYVLCGDPRAGCFYLEHELHVLRLERFPSALREAIRKEYARRGITDDIYFADE